MPIPYLGSKRKNAGKIYQIIKNFNPDSSLLIDLFCGGFSVSEYFLKKGWRVIANDKNKYVIALLNQVLFKGLEEGITTEFISRTKFYEVMNNKDNYDDWYVGYVMCVWNFGNNQRSYLFGKNIEEIKKAGHEIVIEKNADLLKKLIHLRNHS
jgi:adenine-specific DNA methylase